ncbi:MAG TPA: integrating conjugative element protein [Pseudomonas sp.]|uniref:integrating conjugative element protein n=1 Tax=Pseudomonas sp. TaxID=306 RepID=UPI000EDA985E|nr:integrating conjugative element protein [Pseudomonas sp.]HCN61910.1 integrating conjugative element protein [Pseudomonas sp.]
MKRLLMIALLSLPGIVAALGESDELPPVSYNEAALLPIRSPSLRPGPVEPRANNLPGITALFLIGDDPRSHAWLQRRLPELQRLGAAGLVVNVESAAALQALRDHAPGLSLTPVPGDDLAQRLGLNRYPVLITATAIEQ